jgi:uncharacterized iron-regulated membrane protein
VMYARFFRSSPTPRPTKEARMSFKQWVRQIHRWLAITFTSIVVVIFVVLAVGNPPMWLYYTPLPFLFLLMFSGLYMFFLPHVAKWRKARGAVSEEAMP